MASKSKILVACLALLLVLSVGYALFSDTITINGTATAKGSFSISHTCTIDEDNSSGSGSGTCGFVDGKILTNSTLDSPNSAVIFDVVLTNTGTIPAVLKTVDSSNNMASDLETTGDEMYFDSATFLTAYFDLLHGSNEYMGDTAAENAAIVLQPNESVTVKIVHAWAAAENIGFETQPELPEDGASISYNVAFGFEQITVQ